MIGEVHGTEQYPALIERLVEVAVAVVAFTVIDLLVSRLYRPDQAGCS